MSFRRVVILGGAALVLAACADTTAPGSQMHRAGGNAAAKSDSTRKAALDGTMTSTFMEPSCEERGGVYLASGRGDSTCVINDQ